MLEGTTRVEVHALLETFMNMFTRSASFIDEAFFSQKARLPVLGLLSSSARLSRFPDYQMSNQRNFTVLGDHLSQYCCLSIINPIWTALVLSQAVCSEKLVPYSLRLWCSYNMESIVISHSVYMQAVCVLVLNYFLYGEYAGTKVQSRISHSSTITIFINVCSPSCFHLVELNDFSVCKNINFIFMQKLWDRLCFEQIKFLIQAFMP